MAALSVELLSQQNIDLRQLQRKMEGQQSTLAELLRVLRPKGAGLGQGLGGMGYPGEYLSGQGGRLNLTSGPLGEQYLAQDGQKSKHMSNEVALGGGHGAHDSSSSSYSIVRYGLSWERAWGYERGGKGGMAGVQVHGGKKRGGQGGKAGGYRQHSGVSFPTAKERYQAVEGCVIWLALGSEHGGVHMALLYMDVCVYVFIFLLTARCARTGIGGIWIRRCSRNFCGCLLGRCVRW